jgi:hypothetical protein
MLAYRTSQSVPSSAFRNIAAHRHPPDRRGRQLANRWPSAGDAESANKPQPASDTDEATPPFSPLELLVIDIGKGDRLNPAIGPRGALLARLLFGIEVSRPLADPRLEALRVLTISLRRRRMSNAAIEGALAAGLTRPQIEHLRSSRHES